MKILRSFLTYLLIVITVCLFFVVGAQADSGAPFWSVAGTCESPGTTEIKVWTKNYGGSMRNGVTGDYDGDGGTDVAAFHLPSDQFFTDYAGNLGQFGWGTSDSMPLIWDYDGDGKTDVSIYHIPTNQWFVKGVGNLGQFGWGGERFNPCPRRL